MFVRFMLSLAGKIGVRPRLSLTALVAILPVFGLLLCGAVIDRGLTLQAADTRLLDQARLSAERENDSFASAKDILSTLRRLHQNAGFTAANCHRVMQDIVKDYPQFTAIALADATGMINCSSFDTPPAPLHDMDLFRTTMAADRAAFILGHFTTGHHSGKPIVVAAVQLPVSRDDPSPAGIALVGLNLDLSAQLAMDFPESAGKIASLIDTRTGTILLHSGDERHVTGQSFPHSDLVRAMRAEPQGGNIDAIDVDGTPTLFGFAPVPAGQQNGLMMAVGMPRAIVLRAVDRRFGIGIGLAVLAAITAAGTAWMVGSWTQFRTIRSLVEAARRFGRGDFSTKIAVEVWQAPEFRMLSATLNTMADSIAEVQMQLSASEGQLRLLAENSTDMILRIRQDGVALYASPACRTLIGVEPAEALQISRADAVHPDDRTLVEDPGIYLDPAGRTLTYRLRRKDGSHIWVEGAFRLVPGVSGRMAECIAVVRDISQRVAAEQRLRESEERYRLLEEHGTDMVFQLDQNCMYRYVSPACRDILGYEPQVLVGDYPKTFIHPEDSGKVDQVYQSVLSGAAERGLCVGRARRRDGHWIWVEAHFRAWKEPQTGMPGGLIGSLRDISARKAIEEQLEIANQKLHILARQDGLTGLANRRAFDEAMKREPYRALRDGAPLALILLDVDCFKSFNDRYGHLAGDECLRQVSDVLKQMARRAGDIAARYGGEEFAIILPGTDEAGAAFIAEAIRQMVFDLAIPHPDSRIGRLSVSAGVAAMLFPTAEGMSETLPRSADRALYRAKGSGRNRVSLASLADADPDFRLLA